MRITVAGSKLPSKSQNDSIKAGSTLPCRHRLTLTPVEVSETGDKFGATCCTKCGAIAGVENFTTRKQIQALVESLADFLRRI